MKEVWKLVEDLPRYEISNKGRLRNKISGRVLKTHISKLGYEQTNVTYLGVRKFIAIHRLVAKAFIDNPHDKPEVNHVDEGKSNNHVTNLEWVTRKENLNHGTWIARKIETRSKPIIATKDGVSKEYASTKAFAKEFNIPPTNVTQALRTLNKNGTKKRLKGHTFEYKEEAK